MGSFWRSREADVVATDTVSERVPARSDKSSRYRCHVPAREDHYTVRNKDRRGGEHTMVELANQAGSTPILGRCPACDDVIPTASMLIEYETGDGWPQMFAECPTCSDVVHPR